MSLLPNVLRARTPDSIRNSPRVRALALSLGLIPPRVMHTPAESAVLTRLARGAARVVEIGVYEGSSTLVLCDAMASNAELHLIDPFLDETGWAMRPGWHGTARATQVAVWRHNRRTGPNVRWYLERSQDVGRRWDAGPVDLVFIDGDHSPEGCREDWNVWHTHVRSGGYVAFHDARVGHPGGAGGIGPTSVVDELLRPLAPEGWAITDEVDSLVVVQRI